MFQIGVIGTSHKENEHRVGIHLDHLGRIPPRLLERMVFERGYGERFDVTDAQLAAKCGGVASRKELLQHRDMVILLPKPVTGDLRQMRDGGRLWGWQHCVQQSASTQAAIERRLTLIAFEEMFVWGPDGHRGRHTFYKNNEMAGYCAVLDALRLKGIDGHYGRQRKVVILSFGAVSRGAIYALKARGFRDITICILRPDHLVREEVLGCHYLRMCAGDDHKSGLLAVEHDGTQRPLLDVIGDADILVNGTFQDPDQPLVFVTHEDVSRLRPGCLIIDVSCDEGMGFSFATPTTFERPILRFGSVDYYAVDHTPSYLWEGASWEISEALIRYLPIIMGGPDRWNEDETTQRAIEILDGTVINPKILSVQRRAPEYPHHVSPGGPEGQPGALPTRTTARISSV